jgi:hypothetical protein
MNYYRTNTVVMNRHKVVRGSGFFIFCSFFNLFDYRAGLNVSGIILRICVENSKTNTNFENSYSYTRSSDEEDSFFFTGLFYFL